MAVPLLGFFSLFFRNPGKYLLLTRKQTTFTTIEHTHIPTPQDPSNHTLV